MTRLASLLLLPLLANPTTAGWIDPDTPEDARTVTPRPVVPAKPPKKKKEKAKKSDGNRTSTSVSSTTGKKGHKHREPTDVPTFMPSYVPTLLPTESPTSINYTPPIPRTYQLVFSDEFNTPHRTFDDGHDPRWTALEKNDYTNDAQHYYSASNAFTDNDGNLVIRSESADTTIVGFNDVKGKREQVTKHFKSAMMQTWNKFCFTGGVLEAEMSLPGRSDVGGLWPAFWMLGNLARHTYVGSSEHVWPWSSSTCTSKSATAQLISACDRVQHYGLHKGVGRGAPEIDVFEVQAGNVKANTGPFIKMPVGQPFMSSSYQVAPGRLPRPGEGWWPAPGQWYDGLTSGMNTSLNIIFYGTYNHFRDDTDPASQDYWSDAISYNRQLNSSYFGSFHKYRVEWELPEDANESNNFTKSYGYLRWFLDDEFVLEVKGEGLDTSGTGAEISSEPMYLLLNTAISSQWGFPQKCPTMCPCKTYNCHGGFQETCGFSEGFCQMMDASPIEYKINYVRVYQDPNDPKQKVGCSTPERPTKKFIEAHEKKYKQTDDLHPLKPIQHGGGPCVTTSDVNNTNGPAYCGGSTKGICQSKTPSTCKCMPNWTGPHCTNPVGYDDIIWDLPETWADLGFNGPSLRVVSEMLTVGVLVVVLFVSPFVLRKQRQIMGGWAPIPAGVPLDYERRVGA